MGNEDGAGRVSPREAGRDTGLSQAAERVEAGRKTQQVGVGPASQVVIFYGWKVRHKHSGSVMASQELPGFNTGLKRTLSLMIACAVWKPWSRGRLSNLFQDRDQGHGL